MVCGAVGRGPSSLMGKIRALQHSASSSATTMISSLDPREAAMMFQT